MSDKKKEVCSYGLGLTQEEDSAMDWLSQMLSDMADACTPGSKRAHLAHRAVGKVLDKAHELHTLAHMQERELEQQDTMLAGIAGIPQNIGLVKKDDLN